MDWNVHWIINLKDHLYKMRYRWYLMPGKLPKMYQRVTNKCWECQEKEGSFYHMWWMCKAAKTFWKQIHLAVQNILKTNLQLNPKIFHLSLEDNLMEKKNAIIIRYMPQYFFMCNIRNETKQLQWKNGYSRCWKELKWQNCQI